MLDPRLLRSFIAIAETGSFTLAASRLHSTQSTISQHLARLESSTGHGLINRAARPVRPTVSGERLLIFARKLVQIHDEAVIALANPAGNSPVRIGIPDDIVTRGMSRKFSIFAKSSRNHRLEVSTGLSRDLARQYRGDELDIAVVKESDDSIDAFARFPEPIGWFESATIEPDLADPVPLVAFPQGGLYRDKMIARMEKEGRRWYIAFTGNSLGSVVSAVEAGVGMSVLPIHAMNAASVRQHRALGEEEPLFISIYTKESSGLIHDLALEMAAEIETTRCPIPSPLL